MNCQQETVRMSYLRWSLQHVTKPGYRITIKNIPADMLSKHVPVPVHELLVDVSGNFNLLCLHPYH